MRNTILILLSVIATTVSGATLRAPKDVDVRVAMRATATKTSVTNVTSVSNVALTSTSALMPLLTQSALASRPMTATFAWLPSFALLPLSGASGYTVWLTNSTNATFPFWSVTTNVVVSVPRDHYTAMVQATNVVGLSDPSVSIAWPKPITNVVDVSCSKGTMQVAPTPSGPWLDVVPTSMSFTNPVGMEFFRAKGVTNNVVISRRFL